MKKILFSFMFMILAMAGFGQTKAVEAKLKGELPKNFTSNKIMVAQDTLYQPIYGTSCDPSFYTFGDGFSTITGTYAFDATNTITDVAQLLNVEGRLVSVEALLFFATNKEAGATKGSFVAEIYDTVGGPSALRPDYVAEATSSSVSFDNIDTTFPGINRFEFTTPYITSEPFWASLNVDNGSDTMAIYATSDNCGGVQPTALFNVNDNSWEYYAGVFTDLVGDPLDFALWVWAEVDTSAGIGLDPRFISNTGLKMFPNPVTDFATIEYELSGEENVTLVVQDLAGREVYRVSKENNNGENSMRVNLSELVSGPHTYQVIGDKKQLNGIFIKK